MTKLQTVLLAIACFVLAGLAYKFVPNAETVAAGLLALGTYLGGTARLHPQDKAALKDATGERNPQKGETNLLVAIVLAVVAVFLGVAFALATNGKAVAMLNKFLPAETVPEPKTAVIDISSTKPAA